MKTLHRYLVIEMIWNVAMFMAVILSAFFVMSMALTLGKSSVEGLPMLIVFRATWYQVVANLNLILPLTVLSSAIFTYGRAHIDGEFTAVRVAGIHPYQMLVPALLVGAFGTLGLAWLQDEVMPSAHFSGRIELRKQIFDSLDDILRGSRREIAQKRWSAMWRAAVDDPAGNLVLEDLLVIQKDKDGFMRTRLMADRARPLFIENENKLRLTLENVKRWEVSYQPSRRD